MKWVEIFEPYQHQVDTVGNIYQIRGGVVPKACQKCKKEFNTERKEFPVIQKVPFYKCKDCNFSNPGGDAALTHKIQNIEHEIERKNKDKVVGVEVKLVGNKSNIKKIKHDIIILCDLCNGI